MKLSLLHLSTSLLFFLLPTSLSQTETLGVVRDTDSKPLRRGREYYILPIIRGRGGGLTIASRNKTCPLNVAQAWSELDSGHPLAFFPVDRKKTVGLTTDMNVVFKAVNKCNKSSMVWMLGDLDETTGRRYVTTGGVKGNPGPGTLSNWFKIDRYGSDYKLVFCPNVCKFCKVICKDVGVFVEGGKRWLGLSDVPFPVMFKNRFSKVV